MKDLILDIFDPDAYMRSTGHAMAEADTAWKTAKVHREPQDAIDEAIRRFLGIARLHLDSLTLAGYSKPPVATMVSLLISIDMAGTAPQALGETLLALHERCLKGCIALCAASADDAFAHPHFTEILRLEAGLYLGTCRMLDCATTDQEALAEAAERYLTGHTAPEGAIIPDASAPAEALIDMMSRLNALALEY